MRSMLFLLAVAFVFVGRSQQIATIPYDESLLVSHCKTHKVLILSNVVLD